VSINLDSLTDIDLGEWKPRINLLLVSCFSLLTSYLLSALIWREIIGDIGHIHISITRAVSVFISANIFRYVPGKIWQIGGLAYLSQKSGIPTDLSILSAILGQLLALCAAGILGLYAIFISQTMEISNSLSVVALVFAVLLVGLYFIGWLGKTIISNHLIHTSYPWRAWRSFIPKWFFLYLLNWMLYIFSFWVFCDSIGFGNDFILIGSAFAGAYVLGYLAVLTPAGLGVREATLVALLDPVIVSEEALIVALLSRLWTTLVEVVPGIPLLISHLRHEKESFL